ncbi:MAG: zinc ribbon domain-containing protein [Desulfovibrionaceae bacterium]
MPIFEYTCEDCGATFEELVFSDSDVVQCTKCGSNNTAKLISRCGFKCGGAPSSGGGEDAAPKPQYRGVGSGCSGCSGGNCSSCG